MPVPQSATRVKVACPCGKKYRCRPHLLGEQLPCRVCGNKFKATETKRKRRLASRECPECNEVLPPNVSFCIHCGYDQESQQGMFEMAPASIGIPSENSASRDNDQFSGLGRKAERARESRLKSSPALKVPANPVNAGKRNVGLASIPLSPLLCAAVLAPLIVLVSYLFPLELNGQGFLAYYGVVLAVCWIFSEWSRDKDHSWLLIGLSIATFLAVGGLRYHYGINHGMQKFYLLFLMMIVGSVLISAGLNFVGEEDNRQGIKLYAYPLCIVFVLTAGCLLWTVIGPRAIMVFAVVFFVLARLFGFVEGGHGSYSSCGGGGGGGCGGGGCGGCGGD